MPRIFLDTLSKFVLKKTVLTATNGNKNSQQTVTYKTVFTQSLQWGTRIGCVERVEISKSPQGCATSFPLP
jgi:hypothetical protein